jgi:hypothetical protein
MSPTRALAFLLPALLAGLMMTFGLEACAAVECEISANCPQGKVCSEAGLCIEVGCSSSLDCNMEEWCSDESGLCTSGCLHDRDCFPTENCDAANRTCVRPGCRNTQLDCEFGEFCNNLTGECYDAGGFYCETCESTKDCGSGNNVCLRMGGSSQTYCGVDCASGQLCPRGYECARVRSLGDVTVGFQCVAACWEL